MDELAHWLCTLTGMPAVALSPKAGAHGEMCGMLAIKAALAARGEGEKRKRVLVPSSAHGTNPATAAAAGFTVDEIPARDDGRVHLDDVKAKLGPDVAAHHDHQPEHVRPVRARRSRTSPTPSTQPAATSIATAPITTPSSGSVRPGDLGVDAMHINLHKTFSTPHGGGGPGAGPTVLSAALAPFAPVPHIVLKDGDARAARTRRRHARRSAACARSMARWACSRARSPT